MDSRSLAREFQLTRVPPGFIDDPYPYYAALREHDPVHDLEGGGVFLTRYEDALAVYRDPRASSDKKEEFRPRFGAGPLYEHHTTSLVFSDPPLHTRVRRLMMGALNQRAITRMEADVTSLVDRLLDGLAERMAGGGTVDFIDEFAARIPVEVIGNRAIAEFVDYLRVLVAERTKKPGDFESDVLTRLIQGEKDGERLSEAELLHNCIFMLNAGHETTTNLIGNGAWLLLTHGGEFSRLRADPGLVASAVEEMLRYEGSIQS